MLEIKKAIEQAGLLPPIDVIIDGKVHRFDSDKKGGKTGWYVFFSGGIVAGSFGCYRAGIKQNWHEKKELNERERAEMLIKFEQAKKAREAELQSQYKAAALQAQIIWDAAQVCNTHPYLEKKLVKSYGLRVGRWTKINEDGEIYLDVPDALLIPITDGAKIASLQAIYPLEIRGRDKDFLAGGKKRGCYHVIGDESSDIVYLCEGYSTGASIYEAVGGVVYVCFDAGNLKSVAEKIREKKPIAKIIVCADDDQWGDKNTGLDAARETAELYGCIVTKPVFNDYSTKPTDYNDLMRLEGVEAVKKQLTFEPEPAEQARELVILEQSKTVDLITPLIDVTSKGKPIGTIENVAEICRRLGVTLRYNVMSKEEEIIIPNEAFSIDNKAGASISWLTSWATRFEMPTANLGQFVLYLCDKNQFNPVTEWVLSKKWDGKSRVNEFIGAVDAENSYLAGILIKRWMIAAIAAAFSPEGISFDGVLVFQGEQAIGKTRWLKDLAPPEFSQDGVVLNIDSRDSIKQATCKWLVELGEIDATFKKSGAEKLKSFLTRNRDTYRKAYAVKDGEYARRTVFFGSVNPRNFLVDPTGNRRFWTVAVKSINHNHGLDMQQVWAEFYELWRSGESFRLTESERILLNESNEEFGELDPVDDVIYNRLDWNVHASFWAWQTATEILNRCGIERPTKQDVTRCALMVRKKNGGQSRRTFDGRMLFAPTQLKQLDNGGGYGF